LSYEIYGDPNEGRYEMLVKYCEEYDIILLDHPDILKPIIYRFEIFTTEFSLDYIMETFDEMVRIPKTVLLEASENTSKDYVMSVMDKEGFSYPVIIKSNR
jgi:hypothetical protein